MRNLQHALSYFPSTKNATFSFGYTGETGSVGLYGVSAISSSPDEKDGVNGEYQLDRVGFEETMSNIAASLTRYGLKETNNSVNGTVHVTKGFVSVRWPWFIFPGILVFVGIIFLLMTISASKRSYAPLWKSSALAPYYHGIGDVDENEHHEYLTSSAMDKDAETKYVQLKQSENNGRLMLLRRQEKQLLSPLG